MATTYTTIEENDVFAFDAVFVGLAGNTSTYLLHQFKKTNDNKEDKIRLRAVVKSSYAPTSSTVYFQIWNGTTLTWETVDTNAVQAADTVFSLDALVEVNNSNYYDFINQVAVRVYQLNNSGVSKTLSVDQILISFIAQYESKYLHTGNRFVQIYPAITTEYTPKYPHKNPQDDL